MIVKTLAVCDEHGHKGYTINLHTEPEQTGQRVSIVNHGFRPSKVMPDELIRKLQDLTSSG